MFRFHGNTLRLFPFDMHIQIRCDYVLRETSTQQKSVLVHAFVLQHWKWEEKKLSLYIIKDNFFMFFFYSHCNFSVNPNLACKILFDIVQDWAYWRMLLPHLSVPSLFFNTLLSFPCLRNVFPDSLFTLCERSVSLWLRTSFVFTRIRETQKIKIITGQWSSRTFKTNPG